MVYVLIHSPLVGPGTWSPVARELKRRGRSAVVPALFGPAGPPPADWRQAVDAVHAALEPLSDPVLLVGHSGAGLLLPAIAVTVTPPVGGLIFVDSEIPARIGDTPFVPSALLDQLRTLAPDGVLPPWADWFGEDAMRDEVPDDALRLELAQEMPSLSFAFLEQSISSPPGWDRVPCAYVLLSDAYRDAAIEARSRGWRVEEIAGARHLHIVTAPEAVVDVLIGLSSV